MRESTLNVEILDVKGLEWPSNHPLYVHLLCGGNNMYSE